MPKKKIKDLTIEELDKICQEHSSCFDGCPLSSPRGNFCGKCLVGYLNYHKNEIKNLKRIIKEYFNEEIEVE